MHNDRNEQVLKKWSVLLEMQIAMYNLCLSVVKKLFMKGKTCRNKSQLEISVEQF